MISKVGKDIKEKYERKKLISDFMKARKYLKRQAFNSFHDLEWEKQEHFESVHKKTCKIQKIIL